MIKTVHGGGILAKNGKNLTYLRASNQGAILKTILLSGPSTRLELAAALNLTAMSISYITSDLLEKGILPGGAAFYVGNAMAEFGIDPQAVAEMWCKYCLVCGRARCLCLPCPGL